MTATPSIEGLLALKNKLQIWDVQSKFSHHVQKKQFSNPLTVLQYHFSRHMKYLNLMKTTTMTIRWLQLITTNSHKHGKETLIRAVRGRRVICSYFTC